jgi:hypothetical protein
MKRVLLFVSVGLLSVAVMLVFCVLFWYNFCAEASFDLADDSRLPRWFSLQPGHTRADVSVTMSTYYVLCGGCSIFVLSDHKGNTIRMAYGKDSPSLNNSPVIYPVYTLTTVKGITEVIENRKMEPKFYISDNPAVLKELLGSQPIPLPK